MQTVNTMQSHFDELNKGQWLYTRESGSGGAQPPSVLGWYRILRARYHWPLFQAIRYAMWLVR